MAEEAEGAQGPAGSPRDAAGPGAPGSGSPEARPRATTRPATPTSWAERPDGYRARLARRVCAAALGVLLTGSLAWEALYSPAGQALDTVLMESLTAWNGALGGLGTVVTGLVSVEASVVVSAVVVVIAVVRRRPTLAGRALGVVVGANATTQLLKAALDRPDLGVVTVLDNSLPSGHVTFAASVSLALVMVAPEWSRTAAAWLGWAWTSLMGITVMVDAWHRPADVVTAVAIAGVWALALCPMEHCERHGSPARRIMGAVALALVVLAVVGVVVGIAGTDLVGRGVSGGAGYGFASYLAAHPWRERLLALCSAALVTGVVGIVVHEVDRLSWS